VDWGFRQEDHHPKDVEVLVCDKQKRIGKVRKLFKRRSANQSLVMPKATTVWGGTISKGLW